MTVDEIVKLLLAGSFAISLLLVSIQIARLLSKVTDTVEDGRQAVKDVAQITHLATEDYTTVRKEIYNILGFWRALKTNSLTSAFKSIRNLFGNEEEMPAESKVELDTVEVPSL